MLDLLKKIGVPATVAAVIAALVTMVPLLFTVDERYAKASEMKEHISKLDDANKQLKAELAQAVGFQQAMVALIQAGRVPHPTGWELDEETGMMVQAGFEWPWKREKRLRKEREEKERAEQAAAAASAAAAAAAVKEQLLLKQQIEKPANWKELQDGLMRQQQRLQKAD